MSYRCAYGRSNKLFDRAVERRSVQDCAYAQQFVSNEILLVIGQSNSLQFAFICRFICCLQCRIDNKWIWHIRIYYEGMDNEFILFKAKARVRNRQKENPCVFPVYNMHHQ